MKSPRTLDYALIDSGDLRKLERFGEHLLIRPSTMSIWKPLRTAEWERALASFRHGSGWSYLGDHKPLESWELTLGDLKLGIQLQKTGQVGIFPEHSYLLDRVHRIVREQSSTSPAQVLNLFAYTGMASLVALQAGGEVTHVDIAKSCLTWARENVERNPFLTGRIRFLPDDASAFLQKEARRGNRYDLVIADPPSFSRPSKNETWEFEEILPLLLEQCRAVLQPTGSLILSSHRVELGDLPLANMLREYFATVEHGCLSIPEECSERRLPAAFYAIGTGLLA